MTAMVTFDTDPDHYAHWRMSIDGAVATLVLDVDEDRGLRPGYKLKLNSYDLGVDIELADALQRLRFEHPEVRCLVITSGKERMFCSGANIYMLGASSHAWKVNFCKFTNETRNGIEDASLYSGLKSIAALNGTTAGGGYELALACDEILMIDDRSSTVSLPEVPLLAVLPGTGGLTRLTDKRRLRRDLADVFCTTIEGVRADRAKAWGLVDAIATPSTFGQTLASRAKDLAAAGAHFSEDAPPRGIVLAPLKRTVTESGIRYPNLDVALDRAGRVATFILRAPAGPTPDSIKTITALGADWWPLALARELDDAMLLLRTNELDIGTWVMRTAGDPATVLAVDATLAKHADHWLVRETIGLWRRTLSRLDVSARSVFALIDRGSCFAGTLLELALAADRSYMLALPDERDAEPAIALSAQNFGAYPMCNGRTRLANRFAVDTLAPDRVGVMLTSDVAREAGLVTFTPDDIDWDDEIRLALEERASLSPDALSGMEASLRFSGPETMHARIFGRLAAWQNWVFQRPNAVGKDGALKLFGSGTRAKFDWERV
jgi:benzoyl-CoA-dihydrodiol lyase